MTVCNVGLRLWQKETVMVKLRVNDTPKNTEKNLPTSVIQVNMLHIQKIIKYSFLEIN